MGRARGATHAVAAPLRAPAPTLSEASAAIVHYHRYDDQHSATIRDSQLPDFDGLLIEFPRELTESEREQVRGATCYWAFLPFVADGTDVNEWLTGRHFWIDANSMNSRSSDWRKRDIFANLEEMLVEGTPERKSQENSRRWEGIGLAPARIILGHPGDKAPRTPEPVEPLKEGRKGPLYGIKDPRDLLRIRTP